MCQTCTGNDSKSCSDSNEAEVVDLGTVVRWLALSLYWEKPLAQIPPGTLPCGVCVFSLLLFSGKMVHLGVHMSAHVWVWSCNGLATCPSCITHFFSSGWERVQHLMTLKRIQRALKMDFPWLLLHWKVKRWRYLYPHEQFDRKYIHFILQVFIISCAHSAGNEVCVSCQQCHTGMAVKPVSVQTHTMTKQFDLFINYLTRSLHVPSHVTLH